MNDQVNVEEWNLEHAAKNDQGNVEERVWEDVVTNDQDNVEEHNLEDVATNEKMNILLGAIAQDVPKIYIKLEDQNNTIRLEA